MPLRAPPSSINRAGTISRGDQTVGARHLVDDVEACGDDFGAVDDDGRHRHLTAELDQLVAVRLVVAVETPDAAQHGCATDGVRIPQPANQCAVDRCAVVVGGLGGVDHQLLAQCAAAAVGGGQRRRPRQQPTVAFAHLNALDGCQRLVQHRFQLGQHLLHLGCGADSDEHDRHVDVAAEEPGAAALTVHGAVDAEKHRRAGEPVSVQHVADRVVGGRAVDAVLPADVEGQLDRVAAVGQVGRRAVGRAPG